MGFWVQELKSWDGMREEGGAGGEGIGGDV